MIAKTGANHTVVRQTDTSFFFIGSQFISREGRYSGSMILVLKSKASTSRTDAVFVSFVRYRDFRLKELHLSIGVTILPQIEVNESPSSGQLSSSRAPWHRAGSPGHLSLLMKPPSWMRRTMTALLAPYPHWPRSPPPPTLPPHPPPLTLSQL